MAIAEEPQHYHTRHRMARAYELMCKGWTDSQIAEALMEQFKVCYGSARSSIKASHRHMERAAKARAKVNKHRELAKLDAVIAAAWTCVKHYAHQGQIVSTEPAPDLDVIVAAVRERARISGLYETMDPVAVADLVIRFGQDPEGAALPSRINGQEATGTNPYSRPNGDS